MPFKILSVWIIKEFIEVLFLNIKEVKEKIKNGAIKDAKIIAGILYLLLFVSTLIHL